MIHSNKHIIFKKSLENILFPADPPPLSGRVLLKGPFPPTVPKRQLYNKLNGEMPSSLRLDWRFHYIAFLLLCSRFGIHFAVFFSKLA